MGNPGKAYVNSRHNIGYKVVEFLSRDYKAKFSPYFNRLVEIAKVKVYNQLVLITKPLTFMNTSGLALSKLIKSKNINLDQFLVVYDDIDLKVGRIKIKPFGGSGGHKGMKSVIQHLGSKNFPRLRVGIGHPGDPKLVTEFVLAPIKDKQEWEELKNSIIEAKKAIKYWIKYDIQKAMCKFN